MDIIDLEDIDMLTVGSISKLGFFLLAAIIWPMFYLVSVFAAILFRLYSWVIMVMALV